MHSKNNPQIGKRQMVTDRKKKFLLGLQACLTYVKPYQRIRALKNGHIWMGTLRHESYKKLKLINASSGKIFKTDNEIEQTHDEKNK